MKNSGLEPKKRLNILSAGNYANIYDSVVVDYNFDSENNQLVNISDHREYFFFHLKYINFSSLFICLNSKSSELI